MQTVYEFSHPLDSADDANDFTLGTDDRVGFRLFIRIMNGVISNTTFGPRGLNRFGEIVISSTQ